MPNSRPLDELRRRLREGLDPRHIFHAPVWGEPQAMSKALREIRHDLASGEGGKPSLDMLQQSLRRFAQTQTVPNFTELKYVCYGAAVPLGEGSSRLIDRPPLFDRLLQLVENREAQAKQFRRCYQGLLNAYFGYEKYGVQTESGPSNWARLRGFLGSKLDGVRKGARQRGEPPQWVELLAAHRNLLGEEPCAPYASALLNGDTSGLRAVCEGLGIASSSWVWDDALMAYVHLVCDGSDPAFKRGLTGVLDLVNERLDLRLPSTLGTKATALAVSRYARCEDKPEHADLRDTSLARIGNPWLSRSAWAAHVNDEAARQMIEGWLKRRLIKDFFELLAQDGGADLRRLNYWLKWEPQIADMWFVLGTDARYNPTPAFKELRKRMEGRERVLQDPNNLNNAFVMRIGQLLVIEFGMTGNACYVFAAADFKTDMQTKVLSIHALKQKSGATRLSHMSTWESKFDGELRRLLHNVPLSKGTLQPTIPPSAPRVEHEPAQAAFKQPMTDTWSPFSPSPAAGKSKLSTFDQRQIAAYCKTVGLDMDDRRDRGGALWVLMPDRSKFERFARQLESQGFRHAEGKGFWFQDER